MTPGTDIVHSQYEDDRQREGPDHHPEGGADTADAKLAIMEECGFRITRDPSVMGKLLKSLL